MPPATTLKPRGGAKKPAGPKPPKGEARDPQFEQVHPRGRGGEWIQKGDGMQGQPDQRVQHLQNRLNHLGYRVGSDGRFGPQTESTVRRFQADHGLQQDGVVGPATTASLRGARQGQSLASAASYGDKYRGAAGAQARAEQNVAIAGDGNLKKTGTQNAAGQNVNSSGQVVAPTGASRSSGSRSRGTSTYNASDPASIRAFQQANGLQVDGIAGPKTEAKLGEITASSGSARGSGSRSSSRRAGASSSLLTLGTGMGTVKGDKRVENVQSLLDGIGLNLGDGGADGRFGRDTLKALKTFQRRYGLNPDGIFGPKTRRALLHVANVQRSKEKAKPGSTLEEADRDARIRNNLKEADVSDAATQDHEARVRRLLEADSKADGEQRPSKAQGSPAKCASCGKGIPVGLKAGRDRCPHCGKAVSTSAKVIAEGAYTEEQLDEALQAVLEEGIDGADRLLVEAFAASVADAAQLLEAADSMVKASTPEPFSKSKTSNWVARAGGLPAYIQHIAHDLVEKRGKSVSNAIQMAIGIVKRWAKGAGNVDDTTRAAAAKAVKEWEALRAKAHAT